MNQKHIMRVALSGSPMQEQELRCEEHARGSDPLAIDLECLAPFDTIRASTANGTYVLRILDPREARVNVQGGFVVAAFWEGQVVGRVAVGHGLRLLREGSLWRTSRIRVLQVIRYGDVASPEVAE